MMRRSFRGGIRFVFGIWVVAAKQGGYEQPGEVGRLLIFI